MLKQGDVARYFTSVIRVRPGLILAGIILQSRQPTPQAVQFRKPIRK